MAASAFKNSFKYYKARQPPPDLSKVIDFRNVDAFSSSSIIQHPAFEPDSNLEKPFGIRSSDELRLCSLSHLPGFLIVPNALTELGQHYWLLRSLKQLPNLPHKCNLDLHLTVPRTLDDSLYEESEKLFGNSLKTRSEFVSLPIYKLRWATVGYNYHWDTKAYRDEDVSPFPSDLGSLARYLASVIGYGDEFRSEAAIINYYHPDSKLSGHTDHSEEDLDAPIVSVSLGLDAIFLLGGETLDEEPTPIFLKSGDVMVLWKEARLAYHGVPRIFERSALAPLEECAVDSLDEMPDLLRQELAKCPRRPVGPRKLAKDSVTPEHLRYEIGQTFYQHYLKYARININVRQVKLQDLDPETH